MCWPSSLFPIKFLLQKAENVAPGGHHTSIAAQTAFNQQNILSFLTLCREKIISLKRWIGNKMAHKTKTNEKCMENINFLHFFGIIWNVKTFDITVWKFSFWFWKSNCRNIEEMGRCRGSISLKGFDRKPNVAQDLDQLSPLNIERDYVFFLGKKLLQTNFV